MRAIILLSYVLKSDGSLSEIGKERADAALELLTKNKYDRIIVSGSTSGFEKEKPVSESEALKEYLTVNGIDENLIIKEEKSRDTIGNAIFTKKIADKENIINLAIVTSDFHIQRAKYVFNLVFGNGYIMEYAESKTKNLTETLVMQEKENLELTKIFLNDKTKNENLEKLLYKFHPFYMKSGEIKGILRLSDEKLSEQLGTDKTKTILYRKFIEKYLKSKR